MTFLDKPLTTSEQMEWELDETILKALRQEQVRVLDVDYTVNAQLLNVARQRVKDLRANKGGDEEETESREEMERATENIRKIYGTKAS